MDGALALPSSGKSQDQGVVCLIVAAFYRQNGPVESFGRWVPTCRFEDSNRERLGVILRVCSDCKAVGGGELEWPFNSAKHGL